ncbi:Hypothetical protein NTJ_10829 [Nesidiocoris tenuis]|uniref:Uncharacterized protein n=1 Tax=Nesidiocoris tenuis TaxID=355587 RepID=A0ABN7B2G6_9HEMI|nr:Hypothetical protein NTJ_10829 [Nesidiocoris tenuis]
MGRSEERKAGSRDVSLRRWPIRRVQRFHNGRARPKSFSFSDVIATLGCKRFSQAESDGSCKRFNVATGNSAE